MTVSPVGREVARVDGRLKVTGAARYSGDYSATHMSYAHVVTSTVARGTIRSIDTAAALAAPGVLRVYVAGDGRLRLYPLAPEFSFFGENYIPLQDMTVRYYGQIIAVVVAESVEQARDAAALITVTYDAQPPRSSLANGPREPSDPTSTGEPSSVTVLAPGIESIDEALAASDVVVEADFEQLVQHHAAMEPHTVLAEWDGDRLTVHAGAQMPTPFTILLAQRLGVPPQQVRLVGRYVGGGFGARVIVWSEAPVAAAAARELGRPVKLTLTREQMFTLVGHRPHLTQTVRLGASRNGVLNAISHESVAERPAAGGWNLIPGHSTSDTLYNTPNLRINPQQVILDMPSSWAMRAPNEAPGAFALETAMDELAIATGVDPVELRLRNYATVSPSTGRPWSSKHLDECYRDGARRFGWSARSSTPRARVDGQWLFGTGMSSAAYPADRQAASVRIRLLDDDTAVVSTGTSDLGTGAWTMVAVAGADALGLPLGRVTSEIGDSALPPGAPAVGSGATQSTVPAVVAAARDTIDALKQLAVTRSESPWHGKDAGDLRYEQGRLHGNDRSMTFGALLRALGSWSMDATASEPAGAAPGYTYHSFGAHFCEVRVNRFTGEIRVTRFTTVVDAGRIINARAARSQIVGGVIFGISGALLEGNHLEHDTGRLAGSNLADYLVAVNADIPHIDVHLLDRPDPHLTGPLGEDGGEVGTRSLGARGLGEIGTVGSAAAVGNAVFNATGIRVRTLPITLDKLL
ncbi:xanthine dehydrogenase YagR molybdenum-binding subunit [Streptomyces sp. SAI-117]|uniref:xanthine dehydrogenase family protein molybdopterin-binding subunit n=1 Tax=Streptomyces sp. SAI-117 TaxID=2940546 RepID=UPI0024758E5C|nr:xanthine dehydrogenase family protein molybdopterin-binding subunit [Streptomyces sp. SAI-117]MDH6565097.1 xanthine dehydrogenase YagR molybdenum-binding subunit [Streptomyces sp. SAI-117]